MAKLKFNGVVTEVYTTPEKEKVNSIETGANKTEFATTSEATTATDNTKAMTPLRTKEAILALSPPPDLSGYATIIALDEKVDKVTGMGLSKNDYTDVEKTKLAGIATGANNYTHPTTHPPSIITQDANNRFVTDAEKTAITHSNRGILDKFSEIGGELAYNGEALGGESGATNLTLTALTLGNYKISHNTGTDKLDFEYII